MCQIAKRIVITNQDIIGEQYITNDDGILAVSQEDEKIAQKRLSWKVSEQNLYEIGKGCLIQILLGAYLAL